MTPMSAQKAALAKEAAQTQASYVGEVLKDLSDAPAKEGELLPQLTATIRKSQEAVLCSPITGAV